MASPTLKAPTHLPAGIRIKIWRMTVDDYDAGEFVPYSWEQDARLYRQTLPVISRVSRESRAEFMRFYHRLSDKTDDGIHRPSVEDGHDAYLNPRIDTLVLGIAKTGKQVPTTRDWSSGNPTLVRTPALNEEARGQLRRVQLHDRDHARRVRDLGRPPRARGCLPDLVYPGLESIWVLDTFFWVVGRGRGTLYTYVLPTRDVYAKRARVYELWDAESPFQWTLDLMASAKCNVQRVDLVRDGEAWENDGSWICLSDGAPPPAGESEDVGELRTQWVCAATYIAERLGADGGDQGAEDVAGDSSGSGSGSDDDTGDVVHVTFVEDDSLELAQVFL